MEASPVTLRSAAPTAHGTLRMLPRRRRDIAPLSSSNVRAFAISEQWLSSPCPAAAGPEDTRQGKQGGGGRRALRCCAGGRRQPAARHDRVRGAAEGLQHQALGGPQRPHHPCVLPVRQHATAHAGLYIAGFAWCIVFARCRRRAFSNLCVVSSAACGTGASH